MSEQSGASPEHTPQELAGIIRLEATEAEATIRALMAHVRQLETALEETTIDPLTMLLNKHGYEKLVLPDLERTLREGATWWVLFGDLDNFKHINDAQGHTSGDQALQQVGAVINQSIRPYDRAVRWGGDEFCIFLKDTEKDPPSTSMITATDKVANRINQALHRTLAEKHAELSISFGSALITGPAEIETAIHKADIESLSSKPGPR